jgi:hypothetical protein
MKMNCAHPNERGNYDCMVCVTVWLWNVVIFCRTCHKAVLKFQYDVENETVGERELAIVKWQGKDYVYRDVFMNNYNTMTASMANARVTFKAEVATYLGLAGMDAFLDKNSDTHIG